MVKEGDSSDEISIDFDRIKNFFKKLLSEKEDSPQNQKKPSEPVKERYSVFRSKTRNFFKNSFNKDLSGSSEDLVSIDWKKLKKFLTSYQVFLLLLIPIILSIYLRVQPAYMPITDSWARDTIHNSLRANIALQIESQYPNLRDDQKQELVEKQFQEFITQNYQLVQDQIKAQSNFFKSRMQDDSGQTYLTAIDPYYYARHARNLIENGHIGDELKNGRPYNNHQLAPLGKFSEANFHMWFEAYLYKFIKFFKPSTNLTTTIFYVPVILAALSVIPAFFIGRKVGGNISGLFASVLIAVHPAFLNRTIGGFADTDAYNILMPLIAVWLFLLMLDAPKLKFKIFYGMLNGFVLGMYSLLWLGWWYIFDFMLLALGIMFLVRVLFSFYSPFALKISIQKSLRNFGSSFLSLFLSASLFFIFFRYLIYKASLFNIISQLGSIFFSFPISIIHLKSVALIKLWPNVLTTVAELNPASFDTVVSTLGGKILFYIALLGLILIFFKSRNWKQNLNYTILLLIWFAGTFYSTSKGLRFMLLLVPPFAFSLAVVAGFLYTRASKIISQNIFININICRILFIILFCLFFVVDVPHVYSAPLRSGYNLARGQVPSMNDGWWSTLTTIKDSTNETAIISSWWDFGHWFKYIADRPVTFDGASQDTPQAHWIGKFFLTDNEEEAVGILRMLDCDGNHAFDRLYNYTKNDFLSAIEILNPALSLGREQAQTHYRRFLTEEQVQNVLDSSHCLNPPEAVVIVSEDMVQKSGVWAHFGGWNFTKAAMVNNARKGKKAFVEFAKTKLELDESEIESTYQLVKSLGIDKSANDWISSWPSYAGFKPSPCIKQTNQLVCANGLVLNMTNYQAEVYAQEGVGVPNSLVYIDKTGKIVKKEYEDSFRESLGFILIPIGKDSYASQIAMPPLEMSMFTKLFYYEGHGLEHFQKISDVQNVFGQRIISYKIDWSGKSKISIEKFLSEPGTNLSSSNQKNEN